MNTTIENASLPASILTKSQFKNYGPKFYTERGTQYRIVAHVRYDDQCGNGHNSFAITATIDRKAGGRWMDDSGGCCHDEVAKHFPELAPFIKWHLTSSGGPMHYAGNVVYLAGDRDCYGLRKGEFKQARAGKSGKLLWHLQLVHTVCPDTCIGADEKPADVVLKWEPVNVGGKDVGEGKERELDAARRCAVWPEATDEELTAPGLEKRLADRLPALMAAFKADIEKLGFVY